MLLHLQTYFIGASRVELAKYYCRCGHNAFLVDSMYQTILNKKHYLQNESVGAGGLELRGNCTRGCRRACRRQQAADVPLAHLNCHPRHDARYTRALQQPAVCAGPNSGLWICFSMIVGAAALACSHNKLWSCAHAPTRGAVAHC